jgi:hypothetical protein
MSRARRPARRCPPSEEGREAAQPEGHGPVARGPSGTRCRTSPSRRARPPRWSSRTRLPRGRCAVHGLRRDLGRRLPVQQHLHRPGLRGLDRAHGDPGGRRDRFLHGRRRPDLLGDGLRQRAPPRVERGAGDRARDTPADRCRNGREALEPALLPLALLRRSQGWRSWRTPLRTSRRLFGWRRPSSTRWVRRSSGTRSEASRASRAGERPTSQGRVEVLDGMSCPGSGVPISRWAPFWAYARRLPDDESTWRW